MIKVNLLSSRPSMFKRVVREIRSAAPQIGRAALMVLPAIFGMPVAITMEMPRSFPFDMMSALRSRAETAIAFNRTAVDSSIAREKDLRRQTDTALSELDQQVVKFGRAFQEDEDRAYVLLNLIKHRENSYLTAANELFNFIKFDNLALREKILIRAQAELRGIETIEEMMEGESPKAVIPSIKARLSGELSIRTTELQELEKQLAQMDGSLEFHQAQIDQACEAEKIVSGDISLREVHTLLELKLGWYRTQLATFDFRRNKVMPVREQVAALETLLLSLFRSDTN